MAPRLRVRFAPSPTGYLHVGGARTALFNWLLARRHGGVFVLRIEDTDRERSSGEMTQAIVDGMSWLGLHWDEGPVHQADGVERHRADAYAMLERGAAYRCFCAREELDARRAEAEARGEGFRYDRRCLRIPPEESAARAAAEPFTLRFRVPEGTTEWNDSVHGETRFSNEDLEDFIILRTDGTPIYNLAVVSDDVDMRITHVIRGDDHLSNTPKQILLYEAMGAEVPAFAHLPMILGPDGKRLSKRHGATAVGEYEEQGILPEALNNFLALLGWSPGNDLEVMSMMDMVERFSLDRINKKSSVFDPEKLLWMNGQHLMNTPSADLLPEVASALAADGLIAEGDVEARRDWLLALVDLYKVRARSVADMAPQMRPLLADSVTYDEADVAKQWKNPEETVARLGAVRDALAEVGEWEPGALEAALRVAAERAGAGFGKVVHPLRLALTGGSASPGIDQVLFVMGRERALGRIDAATAFLRAGGTQ